MTIDFQKSGGLVPAIVQDARSQAVLMLGYMNQEALKKSRDSGKVTFYSRSKQRLWVKGETSGNYLELVSITPDCDSDALLVQAIRQGPVCHLGNNSCFNGTSAKGFLYELESVIHRRKVSPERESYTATLFAKGLNKIAQKVGEEATELIIEAKDDNADLFKGEAADLLYHLLVLFAQKGITLSEIEEVLSNRHQ